MIQLGVKVGIDDLTANDREMLLLIAEEIQLKQEQKARLNNLK